MTQIGFKFYKRTAPWAVRAGTVTRPYRVAYLTPLIPGLRAGTVTRPYRVAYLSPLTSHLLPLKGSLTSKRTSYL